MDRAPKKIPESIRKKGRRPMNRAPNPNKPLSLLDFQDSLF